MFRNSMTWIDHGRAQFSNRGEECYRNKTSNYNNCGANPCAQYQTDNGDFCAQQRGINDPNGYCTESRNDPNSYCNESISATDNCPCEGSAEGPKVHDKLQPTRKSSGFLYCTKDKKKQKKSKPKKKRGRKNKKAPQSPKCYERWNFSIKLEESKFSLSLREQEAKLDVLEEMLKNPKANEPRKPRVPTFAHPPACLNLIIKPSHLSSWYKYDPKDTMSRSKNKLEAVCRELAQKKAKPIDSKKVKASSSIFPKIKRSRPKPSPNPSVPKLTWYPPGNIMHHHYEHIADGYPGSTTKFIKSTTTVSRDRSNRSGRNTPGGSSKKDGWSNKATYAPTVSKKPQNPPGWDHRKDKFGDPQALFSFEPFGHPTDVTNGYQSPPIISSPGPWSDRQEYRNSVPPKKTSEPNDHNHQQQERGSYGTTKTDQKGSYDDSSGFDEEEEEEEEDYSDSECCEDDGSYCSNDFEEEEECQLGNGPGSNDPCDNSTCTASFNSYTEAYKDPKNDHRNDPTHNPRNDHKNYPRNDPRNDHKIKNLIKSNEPSKNVTKSYNEGFTWNPRKEPNISNYGSTNDSKKYGGADSSFRTAKLTSTYAEDYKDPRSYATTSGRPDCYQSCTKGTQYYPISTPIKTLCGLNYDNYESYSNYDSYSNSENGRGNLLENNKTPKKIGNSNVQSYNQKSEGSNCYGGNSGNYGTVPNNNGNYENPTRNNQKIENPRNYGNYLTNNGGTLAGVGQNRGQVTQGQNQGQGHIRSDNRTAKIPNCPCNTEEKIESKSFKSDGSNVKNQVKNSSDFQRSSLDKNDKGRGGLFKNLPRKLPKKKSLGAYEPSLSDEDECPLPYMGQGPFSDESWNGVGNPFANDPLIFTGPFYPNPGIGIFDGKRGPVKGNPIQNIIRGGTTIHENGQSIGYAGKNYQKSSYEQSCQIQNDTVTQNYHPNYNGGTKNEQKNQNQQNYQMNNQPKNSKDKGQPTNQAQSYQRTEMGHFGHSKNDQIKPRDLGYMENDEQDYKSMNTNPDDQSQRSYQMRNDPKFQSYLWTETMDAEEGTQTQTQIELVNPPTLLSYQTKKGPSNLKEEYKHPKANGVDQNRSKSYPKNQSERSHSNKNNPGNSNVKHANEGQSYLNNHNQQSYSIKNKALDSKREERSDLKKNDPGNKNQNKQSHNLPTKIILNNDPTKSINDPNRRNPDKQAPENGQSYPMNRNIDNSDKRNAPTKIILLNDSPGKAINGQTNRPNEPTKIALLNDPTKIVNDPNKQNAPTKIALLNNTTINPGTSNRPNEPTKIVLLNDPNKTQNDAIKTFPEQQMQKPQNSFGKGKEQNPNSTSDSDENDFKRVRKVKQDKNKMPKENRGSGVGFFDDFDLPHKFSRQVNTENNKPEVDGYVYSSSSDDNDENKDAQNKFIDKSAPTNRTNRPVKNSEQTRNDPKRESVPIHLEEMKEKYDLLKNQPNRSGSPTRRSGTKKKSVPRNKQQTYANQKDARAQNLEQAKRQSALNNKNGQKDTENKKLENPEQIKQQSDPKKNVPSGQNNSAKSDPKRESVPIHLKTLKEQNDLLKNQRKSGQKTNSKEKKSLKNPEQTKRQSKPKKSVPKEQTNARVSKVKGQSGGKKNNSDISTSSSEEEGDVFKMTKKNG